MPSGIVKTLIQRSKNVSNGAYESTNIYPKTVSSGVIIDANSQNTGYNGQSSETLNGLLSRALLSGVDNQTFSGSKTFNGDIFIGESINPGSTSINLGGNTSSRTWNTLYTKSITNTETSNVSSGKIVWNGDIEPYNTNNGNLGSSEKKWNNIYGNQVHGGVWNDYAEFRNSDVTEPGRVIKENGDGTLSLTTGRLERGCEIVTDTYGFSIGQTDSCRVPTAAAGRVLAYPDTEPIDFVIGAPVCSGPNGTVSMMTQEEEWMYPSRIIGTVSEIPTYDTWNDIKVNGRIWIRIK